jgi:two-component system response regulator BaeR
MTKQRILVVEDETKRARLLEDYLASVGYATHWIAHGAEVVPWVREHAPDLILLDLMLPGKSGLDICREIRGFSQVPIVMVTARVEEIDRLLGLELGADDYVCKPFSPREVIARVKAVLRRTSLQPTTVAALLEPDPGSFRIRAGQNTAELTAVEYNLFAALFEAPGRIFSRDQLMDRVYKDGRVVSDRTIDSHIKKLRRKLLAVLPDYELIHSVYGAGYRYEPVPRDD